LIAEDRLGVHSLTADVRFEANTLPLMTDLVTAGLGYTVLPLRGVRDPLRQGRASASPVIDLFVNPHVLTRSPPLTPAVLVLIVGLQDANKISHAGSIPVFDHNNNLSIGRGLAPLPNPH
jgi:DNA-binding transcriptional LysR family regulator